MVNLKNKIKHMIYDLEEVTNISLCDYCKRENYCRYELGSVVGCTYFKRNSDLITSKGIEKNIYIPVGKEQGIYKVYKRGKFINWRKRNE